MPRTLVLTAALLAMLAGSASAESWTKTYDVGGGSALRLQAEDADVQVTGWSEPRIRIDVEAEGRKIGPGGLRLVQGQTGDRVEFELHGPVISFHFNFNNPFPRRSVRIDVHVPVKTALELKTGDGDVTCENLEGDLSLATGDGRMTADDLRGVIHLHTDDGRVDARGLDGAVTASSGDGNVRLHGRYDALDVSTSDGGLTVDVAPGSRVGDGWRVHTGDGPLVLRLPGDLKASIDARSGDGGITVDMPLQMSGPIRENQLHATLNGGGAELRVRSGDGSILLEPFVAEPARTPADAAQPPGGSPARHKLHSIKHGH